MNNIYSDFGNIIEEYRYVSRVDMEKKIRARLIDNPNYGSISVMGMQRIGKSSLAYNLLEGKADQFLEQKMIVFRVSMYQFDSVQSFFTELVEQTYAPLCDIDAVTVRMKSAYENAMNKSVEETGGKALISFFTAVKAAGYRVICVVDEFDSVRTLFKKYPQGFFVLRDLAYEPKNRVGFLFLSRRHVTELEESVGCDDGVSNFSNILSKEFLGMYTDAELGQWYSYLEQAGVTVDAQFRKELEDIVGRYPYWMDILAFHYIVEAETNSQITLQQVFEAHWDTFYSEFRKLFSLLEEQNLLNALYQCVLGPMGDDATKDRIKRLEDYGIIRSQDEKWYCSISKYFREYMVMREQNIDFYPLWNRTEKLFRAVGAKAFGHTYGADWEDQLLQKYPTDPNNRFKPGNFLAEAKSRVEDMKTKTAVYEVDPDRINLLNGTTTGGLFSILAAEYETSGLDKVFKMRKGEFVQKTNALTSARNPYDHNNDEWILEDVKSNTVSRCTEFLTLMEAYLELK